MKKLLFLLLIAIICTITALLLIYKVLFSHDINEDFFKPSSSEEKLINHLKLTFAFDAMYSNNNSLVNRAIVIQDFLAQKGIEGHCNLTQSESQIACTYAKKDLEKAIEDDKIYNIDENNGQTILKYDEKFLNDYITDNKQINLLTIQNRLSVLGLKNAKLSEDNAGNLVVEVDNFPERRLEMLIQVISSNGDLTFSIETERDESTNINMALLPLVSKENHPDIFPYAGNWCAYDVFTPDSMKIQKSGKEILQQFANEAYAQDLIPLNRRAMYQHILPNNIEEDGDMPRWCMVFSKADTTISSNHLVSANKNLNSDMNLYFIELAFDPSGTQKFYNLTKENISSTLLISLDDEVLTNPIIRDPIPGGIVIFSLTSGNPKYHEDKIDLTITLLRNQMPGKYKFISTEIK